MRLDDEEVSKNIEDRRGGRGGFGFPRARRGRMRIPIGGRRGGGMSIGGVLILLVLAWLLGINPLELLTSGGGGSLGGGGLFPQQREYSAPSQGTGSPLTQDAMSNFVGKVLRTTERTWEDKFGRAGRHYEKPRLVLFTGLVNSACGSAQSAMGPFYCPADKKIYIDLSFYHDLREKLGAPGDFAQAYVIAHEVGHHVQNLLGIAGQVHQQKLRLPKAKANALSVRLELQADCFAGIWAHSIPERIEDGDIEEGLNAASAIGDDRLQRRSGGRVVPESFTHGTSAQRVRWFKRGIREGRLDACDTFKAASL